MSSFHFLCEYTTPYLAANGCLHRSPGTLAQNLVIYWAIKRSDPWSHWGKSKSENEPVDTLAQFLSLSLSSCLSRHAVLNKPQLLAAVSSSFRSCLLEDTYMAPNGAFCRRLIPSHLSHLSDTTNTHFSAPCISVPILFHRDVCLIFQSCLLNFLLFSFSSYFSNSLSSKCKLITFLTERILPANFFVVSKAFTF